MKRLVVSLVIVLLVAGAGLAVYRYTSSRASAPAGEQPRAGTGPARILLNEILFQPGANQTPWIEIVNAGGATGTLDGLVLENQDGQTFALSDRQRLNPGAVIVVSPPAALLARNGSIRLRSAAGALDRIAWGDGQGGAANLSRGGFDDGLADGSSLGRAPGSARTDPLDWIPYSPAQATPGSPNQQPAVEILLPMDGAIVSTAAIDLAWYTVPATTRYHVQVATDPSFASPLVDLTVDAPPLTTPVLAAASYWWRVQAIGANGTAANYSAPSALTVRAAQPRALRNQPLIDAWFPVLHASADQPDLPDEQLPTVLDVPLIQQHKDTGMLLLETPWLLTGHTWDAEHDGLAGWDAADNMNCAPASLAMLVQYYKQKFHYPGRLSQDRINYEMFHAESTGPEGDLSWGRGYSRERITQAMAFAFGVPPQIDPPAGDDDLEIEALWRARISAGMPGILCKNRHCVTVTGIGGRPTVLVINDPGFRGTYLAPLGMLREAVVFVMARPERAGASTQPMLVRPRSDEPGITTDSDGDGIVDFDEINRFHTNPASKDTDQDELPDKADIRASVLDYRFGFSHGGNGRDFDGDGKPMELDADADGGGCLDGAEDTNKDGIFDFDNERDNFENKDDDCISGSYRYVSNVNRRASPDNDTSQKHTALISITFSARNVDGPRNGRAIVTFSQRDEFHSPPGNCVSDSVLATDPYEHGVDVTVEVVNLPDGSAQVVVKSPVGWTPPLARYVSSCPEIPPIESPGPDIGIAGVVRDGVFDHRMEMPLAPNETGASWIETHIRMSARRR